MTVSNVVNGNHAKVSQKTIERVQTIVDARGYVPSASARSLAANTSRLIGLLVPSGDDDSLMLSPHNVAVFGILERKLRDHGYNLLFRGVSGPGEVDQALKSWNLDGAVLLGFLDEEVDTFEPPAGTPILALDSYSTNARSTGVRSDDYEGGRRAAEYLIARGHRRLLFAAPAFSDVGVVRQRFEGFLAAHRAAGLTWSEQDVATVDTSYAEGIELGRVMGSRHPEVTGVFATADILAIGIIRGVQLSGGTVPGSVSVIGFDNIEIGQFVTPTLTTIGQNVAEKADVAVQMLLEEIEERRTPGEPVVVPIEIVERDSVDAPRA